jgi:integrase
MRSPAKMGEREIRDYLLSQALRQVSPAVLKMHVAGACDFCTLSPLRRPEEVAWLDWPKVPRRLPDILSRDEVESLLRAVEPLLHRAIIMTAYGAGLRISEVCKLQTTDIDGKRGVIHVRDGKARTRPLRDVVAAAARVPARVLPPDPPTGAARVSRSEAGSPDHHQPRAHGAQDRAQEGRHQEARDDACPSPRFRHPTCSKRARTFG